MIPLSPEVRERLSQLRLSGSPPPVERERAAAVKKTRVFGLAFVTLLLAFVAVAVRPALLDPLCDDYDWGGSAAASAVRDAARVVHHDVLHPLGL